MPTAKSGLSSPDICAIIASCAQHKCLELKFGDMYLRFGPPVEEPTQPSSKNPKTDTAISEQHKNQSQNALDKDAKQIREEQLAMLQIEDPVEYERMIRDEELEDADDEPGDQ